MKIIEIVDQYNLDESSFTSFVKNNAQVYGYNKSSIPDEMVEKAVAGFRKYLSDAQAQYRARTAETQFKQKALSEMLIKSGFTFDGYTITKYSGYISGDDAVEIPRYGLFKDNGQNLTNALVQIRRKALMELKEAAYNLGCNAVIGVDFDYMTLEPERNSMLTTQTKYEPYVICVTANGNAVVIEKNQTNVVQAFAQQQPPPFYPRGY